MEIAINKRLTSLFCKQTEKVLDICSEIDLEVKKRIGERFKNATSYNSFLIFCCDIGRLDIVYYLLNYIDIESPLLSSFILEKPNIKRIKDFSKYPSISKLQKESIHEFNCENGVSLKAFFFKKLNEYKLRKEVSYIDNMYLSFIVNLLFSIKEVKFSEEECVEIIYYFKKAIKCENIRKQVITLLVFDYAIRHRLDSFFTPPARNFNYLTDIQSAITNTALLSEEFRSSYFTLFSNRVKYDNSLSVKKDMKVAVCVSGMYRNHERALISIKENLIDPLEADVFIHTWDNMAYWPGYGGSPSCGRTLGSEAEKLLPRKYTHNLLHLQKYLPLSTEILKKPLLQKNNIEVLNRYLNPLEMIIENEKKFEESLANPEGFKKARGSLNQIKMFWGIKQSFDLALKKGGYDVIIRIRPDVVVLEPYNKDFFSNVDSSTLYSRVTARYGIRDLVFHSDDIVAYSLSKFVSQMIDRQEVSPFEKFPLSDSHALLALWVFSNKLTLNSKRIRTSLEANPIVKLKGLAEAMELDFSSLKDSEKMELQEFCDYVDKTYGC